MRLVFGKRSTQFSDTDIINGIRHGDLSYVDLLYKKCNSEVYRHVLNKGGNDDEAKDIIQETVITVYEKIKDDKFKLNQDTRLTTFLMAVAKYKWSNQLRKKGGLVIINEDYLPDIHDETDESILQEERFEYLKEMIERLDEICRQILRERYWLKRKFDEIKISGCNTTEALKMKSSRCHKQLKMLHG